MSFRGIRERYFIRTGIFFKYKVTLPLLCGLLYFNILFAFIYSIVEKDSEFARFLYTDFLTYSWIPFFIIIVYIVRYSVKGYEKLIDNPKFKSLFRTDTNYANYLERVNRFLNKKWEIIISVFFSILIIFIYYLPSIIRQEHITGGRNYFSSGFLIVSFICNLLTFIIGGFAAGSFLYYISCILLSLGLFWKGNIELSLDTTIFNLTKDKKNHNEKRVSYEEFHHSQLVIGDFLFSFSSRLILLSIFITIVIVYQVLMGNWNDRAYFGPVIMFVLTLSLSSIPQLLIHSFLKKGKAKTIDSYKNKYFKIKKIIIQMETNTELDCNIEDLIDKANFYEMEIKRIEKTGTWSYSFSKTSRVLLGSLISIIPSMVSFIQYLISL